METCNESISSLFDDSSHSESNTKEECCDGDDELTDVEGGNDCVDATLVIAAVIIQNTIEIL